MMPDALGRAIRGYVVVMAACAVASVALVLIWVFLGGEGIAQLVVATGAYFVIATAVIMTISLVATLREDIDAQETCNPVLSHYRATGDVDELLYAYEVWRTGRHNMATRIAFLEEVTLLLVSDGYLGEAADKLDEMAALMRSGRMIDRYQRFCRHCEKIARRQAQ